MKKCATCNYFKRGFWGPPLQDKKEPQKGGHCELLKAILGMTNNLWSIKELHVQESFGCVLHKDKK